MTERDDMREFMIVLRRALLLILDYIERRYELGSAKSGKMRVTE